ncbi:HNH endonuclease [Clostridium chromiireducens]|uniref:HNH endonuclease n=1 Tax=Clostridium chromiireducens TaxID=225345 RepID=A0A1V4J157_9CLOT|nr:HNH endonuclease signature motif containing protein [Clostridium chromiireducens]OPJ65744.1 HNH endonuclease [Clostridium chromiireducens]
MNLDKLLINNDIKEDSVKEIVLNMILLSIFEEIYNHLERESNKEILKNKLRRGDTNVILRELIENIITMKLQDCDYEYISSLIIAYLRKNDIRKKLNDEEKRALLLEQEYKCEMCHCRINIVNSCIDHIVPFKMVGDELKDNYQLLCEQCNLNKSSSLNYYLKTIVKRFVRK